ncbi:unnamed protein product [Pleuronectes platessa]|uniref:Uncharacterized protein n=1 Tax=Pleuronectes platessa TaxID=8262 RepID=A0A9N7VND8_PLEPL|nr:unnamed protein product [Pleuronectes platessa]
MGSSAAGAAGGAGGAGAAGAAGKVDKVEIKCGAGAPGRLSCRRECAPPAGARGLQPRGPGGLRGCSLPRAPPPQPGNCVSEPPSNFSAPPMSSEQVPLALGSLCYSPYRARASYMRPAPRRSGPGTDLLTAACRRSLLSGRTRGELLLCLTPRNRKVTARVKLVPRVGCSPVAAWLWESVRGQAAAAAAAVSHRPPGLRASIPAAQTGNLRGNLQPGGVCLSGNFTGSVAAHSSTPVKVHNPPGGASR